MMKKILVGLGAVITILLLGLSATDNMHLLESFRAAYF